jgi:hypothetical protein
LIRGARSHFENGRPVDEGAHLKPYKKLLVDVTASQAARQGARSRQRARVRRPSRCLWRQQWLADEERRRREEDRRRVEQSTADSKTELRQVIERWSDVMCVERFLAGVEQRG